MYKLLKDKNNDFQCEIKLEGTSAKDAKVRLFLEADGCEYVFTGNINEGKCSIPLGRLKKYNNLLESGKIRLEIIAEDTVFTPYESDYQLEEEKKVTVEVIQPQSSPKKQMVEVKVQEFQPSPKVIKKDPLTEIKDYLKSHTIFDGTSKSFHTLIQTKSHKDFFNNICENNGLNKINVLKQILK
jgi:hypothetical protein